MEDIKAHLEKLKTQIAECEMIRDLATSRVKRETFAKMAEHFKVLAEQLEMVVRTGSMSAFLSDDAHQPTPKEEPDP